MCTLSHKGLMSLKYIFLFHILEITAVSGAVCENGRSFRKTERYFVQSADKRYKINTRLICLHSCLIKSHTEISKICGLLRQNYMRQNMRLVEMEVKITVSKSWPLILTGDSIEPNWSKAQKFCHSLGEHWALIDIYDSTALTLILQDDCFKNTHFWIQSHDTFRVKVLK